MKHFWYSLFLMICSLGTVSCSSLSWDELNFPSAEIKTVEETEEEYDYDSAEPSTELNLVQNGASKYVIVHDESQEAADLADFVSDTVHRLFGVRLKVRSSQEKERRYEIVIGNVEREGYSFDRSELKQEFDFSVQVEKDKLFLFANNGCAYLYFKEYLIREVFVRTSFVKLCLTPENSMCYSTSPLSEKTFVDYLKEGGKKIELKEMFASGTHEHQGTALPYRIYFPSNYSPDRKYPIFLNLHGAGIRGSDNQRQLNWIGKMLEEEELALDEAILVFPQCPSDQKWVDIPFGSESYSLDAVPEANELACVVDLIRSLCDRYSVDMGRIYACGFSMGGHATWNLLMNHSDLFCAGIAMCGSGDPTKAQLLKDVPIWAIHGTKDPTVPVTGSRNMVEAILAAGGEKIRYTELPDNQHDVWTYTYQNLEIFRWLLSQNRNQS